MVYAVCNGIPYMYGEIASADIYARPFYMASELNGVAQWLKRATAIPEVPGTNPTTHTSGKSTGDGVWACTRHAPLCAKALTFKGPSKAP